MIRGIFSQVSKIEELKQDWIRSKYEVIASKASPEVFEKDYIYVYQEEEKICLSVGAKIRCLEASEQDKFQGLFFGSNDDKTIDKEAVYKQVIRLGLVRPLSEWEKKDFVEWRKSITHIDYNDDQFIAEMMAVLSQAAHETILSKGKGEGYYPYITQILSLLTLFKSDEGGIFQVGTGDGKTLSIAMAAVIKVIEKFPVNVISSSETLAKRDVVDTKKFFELFDISVDSNLDNSELMRGKPKTCYTKDVVYGTASLFIGDRIRDVTDNTLNGRGPSVLFIDELDYTFIDNVEMKLQLSEQIPGADILSFLKYIYG